MNILYLSHISPLRVENDVTMLEDGGYKVTILNNHKLHFQKSLINYPYFTNIINLYEPKYLWIVKIRSGITAFLKYLLTVTKLDTSHHVVSIRKKVDIDSLKRINSKTKSLILKTLKEKSIEVIYCSWSITGFPEIKAIQEENANIPIILSIQTYPFRGTTVVGNNYEENKEIKKIFENLDGRIHCSKTMHEFMHNNFDLYKHGSDLITMGYFRERYFYKNRLQLLSEKDREPHLIFIGNTQFSQRIMDDVRQQIYDITQKGIHVHFSSTYDRIKDSPYIHMFQPFSHQQLLNGEFATYMTQFDACIVLYNIDRQYFRFNNSLPERFLFALNAGIPIVVPKKYFGSCEEIINNYQIGFSYGSLVELKEQLAIKEIMDEYRDNAIQAASKLTFENNFYILDKFIKDIVGKSKQEIK
jgi:hypothetical protein